MVNKTTKTASAADWRALVNVWREWAQGAPLSARIQQADKLSRWAMRGEIPLRFAADVNDFLRPVEG